MSEVSVVIPSRNRPKLLNQVLASYVGQPKVREILIVDDGSSRSVESALKGRWRDDERVRILRLPRSLGAAAARNAGINEATAPFVFFGEDDAVLDDGHIGGLLAERERLGVEVICGRLIQQQSNETFEQARRRVEGTHEALYNRRIISVTTASVREPVEVPFAHCLFLAPTDLVKEHLFSTHYGGPSFMREDAELQLRLRKSGYPLYVTPAATVFHLAKKKGAGAGTRDYSSVLAQLGSITANLAMLIDEYFEELRPFFPGMNKRQMLTRACRGHLYLGLKNWMRASSPLIDRSAEWWNRARWILQRSN
ncbi:glycosyltransferase family 2 protein [Persicimonas caeni]|uniref:Glycosyltransferase family 2 protein n=1 Tax=Persicimonas caeni TaxID=2292766 RepID=A0A4Y6PTZ6_PERCE|nr:glycosyltransferase [Persicimonas caeni]QDG51713.1 glycosyltransferase family 2 protein [Persicimonas caeni]QED32934.1 glycosyltransferase family 2 protein [Persicimonas caeni]